MGCKRIQHRVGAATRLQITHRLRAGLGIMILGAALLLTLAAASTAYASHSACRTDPIVWLSDGHRMNLVAAIETDSTQVQSITYTLHIPSGVRITNIVYTAGGLGTEEHFSYVADQAPRHYIDTTNVRTAGGSVATTASLQITLQSGGIVGSGATNGLSNSNLNVAVTASQ